MSASETNNNDETMTAEDQDNHLSLWQAIKKYRIIAMYTTGLTLGILLWGYDLVIVGTVASIPAFQ